MKKIDKNICNHYFNVSIFSFILISTSLFYPIFDVNFDFNNFLFFDGFDSKLSLWIYERNFQNIFIEHDILNFWNGRQFFPSEFNLAYSNSIIAAQIFYAPFRLMGFNPFISLLLTFNAVIFISILLFNRELSFLKIDSNFERLFLVIFVFFCPMFTNFLFHYYIYGFFMYPVFFLGYFRYLKSPDNKLLLYLALIFIFISSFATYFVVMGGVLMLFLIFPIYQKKYNFYKNLFCSFFNKPFLLAVSLILLFSFVYFQLLPYLVIFGSDSTDIKDAMPFSLSLRSFFDPSVLSLIYSPFRSFFGYWEQSIFPGFSVYAIIILGLITIYREKHDLKLQSMFPFLFVFIALVFILSLGPYLKFGHHKIPMPFLFISKIVPGFENIRAPGRFAIFLTLPLAFISFQFISIIKHHFIKNTFITFCVCAFLFEGAINSKVFTLNLPDQDFIHETKNMIEPNSPTMILPLEGSSHLESINNFMYHLHYSLVNKGWMVSGYGAKLSTDLLSFVELERDLLSAKITQEEFLCTIKKRGIKNIFILDNKYKFNFGNKDSFCNFNLVYSNSNNDTIYNKFLLITNEN